jgi:hypothetical protein
VNLLELITKNDPNVLVQVWDSASATWVAFDSPKELINKTISSKVKFVEWRFKVVKDIVRGLKLRSGMRVVVRQAARYWPNFASGQGVLKFCSNGVNDVRVILGWRVGDSDSLLSQFEFIANDKLQDVEVPAINATDADLVIQVPLQKGAKLFFGVHRLLDRNQLYARCKGDGIEVGPGPKPQILPDAQTRVKYLEQATPDQWLQLYGKDTKVPVDPELWKLYVVGNADKIPASPQSLDFVFSSHVIEHLANPLGHLAYWSGLLKPGGVVVAIIPDCSGCKDYVFLPSSIEELAVEFHKNSMIPTLAHYQRWAKFRAPNVDPAEILNSGRSIHVHFYTPESMKEILKKMHQEIGFRKFRVISEHNHKDFFVILEK